MYPYPNKQNPPGDENHHILTFHVYFESGDCVIFENYIEFVSFVEKETVDLINPRFEKQMRNQNEVLNQITIMYKSDRICDPINVMNNTLMDNVVFIPNPFPITFSPHFHVQYVSFNIIDKNCW